MDATLPTRPLQRLLEDLRGTCHDARARSSGIVCRRAFGWIECCRAARALEELPATDRPVSLSKLSDHPLH